MPWLEQLQSGNWGQGTCVAVAAYSLGCLTTGYYLVHWRTGRDIREYGSGNVGARNVGRVLGWVGFLVTMLGDSAKGALAVWTTQHFRHQPWLSALALLAVVAGHIWPIQLGFRGGKGVATALGALVVYDFHLAVAFGILFGASAVLMRRTLVPALVAFACLPLAGKYMGDNRAKVVALSVLAGLVVLAHRKNLLEEMSSFMEHRSIHPEHDQREL